MNSIYMIQIYKRMEKYPKFKIQKWIIYSKMMKKLNLKKFNPCKIMNQYFPKLTIQMLNQIKKHIDKNKIIF